MQKEKRRRQNITLDARESEQKKTDKKWKGRDPKPSETKTHKWWVKQGTSEQSNNSRREQNNNLCSQPVFEIAEK